MKLEYDKEVQVEGIGIVALHNGDDECVIKDNKNGFALAVVTKASNNLYPLQMSFVEASVLVAMVSED